MSSNYEVDQQWVEDNYDTIFRIYTRMNQSQASSNRSADLKKLKENADTVRYRGYYELARQEVKRKAQEEIIREEGGSIDLIADLEHERRLRDNYKWLLDKRTEKWRKMRKKCKDLEKERDNYKQIVEKTKSMLKQPIPSFTPKPTVIQATIVEEKKTIKERCRKFINKI
jgi:hypothetical protein